MQASSKTGKQSQWLIIWSAFVFFIKITINTHKICEYTFQDLIGIKGFYGSNVLQYISFRLLHSDSNISNIRPREYTYIGKMLRSHWPWHAFSFSSANRCIQSINSHKTPDRQRLVYRRWSKNIGWPRYDLKVQKGSKSTPNIEVKYDKTLENKGKAMTSRFIKMHCIKKKNWLKSVYVFK